jgi:hypothetical protein
MRVGVRDRTRGQQTRDRSFVAGEERPLARRRAPRDRLDVGLEHHDEGVRERLGARAWIEESSAPERDHHRRRAAERLEPRLTLALAERGFTLRCEERGDRRPRGRLDRRVEIDEARSRRRRDARAERALAGAHESPQAQDRPSLRFHRACA